MFVAGDTVYEYDLDGFLMVKYEHAGQPDQAVTEYEYSSRGELLRVILPDGREVEYEHDAFGRRVAKKIDGVVEEKYLWAGMTTLLAVYDGNDVLKYRFAGPKMVKRGRTYYLARDQVGTVRAVAYYWNGEIVKQIDYDSFGNVLNTGGTDPTFECPLGFAGGFYDKDTNLVHFGFRDYDPETGRWTAKDPVGFGAGDVNLYGYCLADPINLVDPWGLKDYTQEETMAILHGAVHDYSQMYWWSALLEARNRHGSFGEYDYKLTDPSSTFVIKETTITASEFGNYLAGYALYARFGLFGEKMTQIAGHYYEITDTSNEWFFDDPRSVEMIFQGINDYISEEAGAGSSDGGSSGGGEASGGWPDTGGAGAPSPPKIKI